MQIEFERSGGFTNAILFAQADTEARYLVYGAARLERRMTEAEAHQLEALSRDVDVSGMTGDSPRREHMPDQFQYRILIRSPDTRQELQLTEAGIPEALRPLVEALSLLARGNTLP